jgi:precorrin-4 methylase
MLTADDVMLYMGVYVDDELLQEAEEGIARAIRELAEAIKEIMELAEQAEDDGDEELAKELQHKAFELKERQHM